MSADEVAEVAVQDCVMRRDGRGPWGALGEGLDNEECFALGGDDDSVLSAMRSLAAEFFADFAIDFGGDEDAATGFGREICQAREAAGVVGFGEGEATQGGLMYDLRGPANRGRCEIEPSRRYVAAAVIGIFTGVAGDVG